MACVAGAQGVGTGRLGLLIRTGGAGTLGIAAEGPSESKLVRGTDVSPGAGPQSESDTLSGHAVKRRTAIGH